MEATHPGDSIKRVYEHLLERCGGSPAAAKAELIRILHDFYARMATDMIIGFFFDGRDTDAIAAQQAEFLLRAMGAQPSYAGKPPAQAHEQLAPILRGHFDRRLRILEECLRAHGLSVEDIRSWVAFESAFRAAVVEGG